MARALHVDAQGPHRAGVRLDGAQKVASAFEAEAHDLLGLAQGQLAHADHVRLETIEGFVEMCSGHGREPRAPR